MAQKVTLIIIYSLYLSPTVLIQFEDFVHFPPSGNSDGPLMVTWIAGKYIKEHTHSMKNSKIHNIIL